MNQTSRALAWCGDVGVIRVELSFLTTGEGGADHNQHATNAKQTRDKRATNSRQGVYLIIHRSNATIIPCLLLLLLLVSDPGSATLHPHSVLERSRKINRMTRKINRSELAPL